MIQFFTPDRRRTIDIQRQQTRYYFSGCGQSILAHSGLVSVQGGPEVGILTRNLEREAMPRICLVEGPFSGSTIAQMGFSVSDHESESIELELEPGGLASLGAERIVTGAIGYPAFTVRSVPDKNNKYGDVWPFVSADPFHNVHTVRYQTFDEVPRGYRVLMWVISDERKPCAIGNGERIFFSIPLIDLICGARNFPPLEVGYYAAIDESSAIDLDVSVDPFDVDLLSDSNQIRIRIASRQSALVCLQQVLVDSLSSIAKPLSFVRVGLWPSGKTAAMSVRHDYDRLITDLSLNELLDYYDRTGIRCTWYTQLRRAPAHQLRQLIRRGHEIALHSEAKSWEDFIVEVTSLRQLGFSVRGMTAHGGGGGIGFVGDRQYLWAEQVGLEYGEILGRDIYQPARVIHVRSGVPEQGALLVQSAHLSFETSDGLWPKALPWARYRLAAGDHLNLLNHPDLHRSELYKLFQHLDLTSVWLATHGEIAQWVNATRYGVSAALSKGILRVTLASASSQAVSILTGQQEHRLDPGETVLTCVP